MFARLRVIPIGWRQLTVGSVDPRTNSDGKDLLGTQAAKPRKSLFVPRFLAWFNWQRFAAIHNSKCGAKHPLDASRIADRDQQQCEPGLIGLHPTTVATYPGAVSCGHIANKGGGMTDKPESLSIGTSTKIPRSRTKD
jgi:hypothetical protein